MTPDEHRAEAARIAGAVRLDVERRAAIGERIALAQVHATLALAPPPPTVQPQHRWSLDKSHEFPDGTGDVLTVVPTKNPGGVILGVREAAVLMENPDVLRTLASVLTAHADRLESKP